MSNIYDGNSVHCNYKWFFISVILWTVFHVIFLVGIFFFLSLIFRCLVFIWCNPPSSISRPYLHTEFVLEMNEWRMTETYKTTTTRTRTHTKKSNGKNCCSFKFGSIYHSILLIESPGSTGRNIIFFFSSFLFLK